jgi:spore coat protein CotF
VLVNKNEDKFNKVLSTSKENGGLLASIGLKNKDIANEDSDLDGDSEEAPHNKSDLFDTSKDRIAKKAGAKAKDKGKDSDEEFDLGFSSIKKQADKEPAADEQRKEIEEQFKSLYDNDPELRKALERSDVANFTVEEKYQIIEAYMQSGFNAAELQIELEDDDEKALAEMSEEDIELLNANFAQIYARDPELKAMLPDDISQLTLLQKY